MVTSLLIAKVLGVYLVVAGLFLLFKGKTLPQILKDLFGHPAISYLLGAGMVILSTILLLGNNNIWDGTWRTLVTVILWLVLAKGLLYIFAPQVLERLATKKFLQSVSLYGLIIVVAGLCLFYLN